MLILTVVILGVILLTSLTFNILFYFAAERQMNRGDLYEKVYKDFVIKMKEQVFQTYLYMQSLDDKQIFSKDDEVGIAFKEILEILQELNEITQDEEGK